MLTLAVCLFGLLPIAEPVTDEVEVIEVNRLYDEHGNLVLVQNIFRDGYDGYPIRDWRLVRHRREYTYYDKERATYRVDWHDGTTLRSVRAKEVRETWTQYDPELSERADWPKEWRRELSKPLNVMRREMRLPAPNKE